MNTVTGLSPHHPTFCQGCSAPIWFGITTVNHKLMPLDVRPDDKGNVAVSRDTSGTWWARVVKKDLPARAGIETVYMTHFATCPKRSLFARTVKAQMARLAPVIDLRTRRRVG